MNIEITKTVRTAIKSSGIKARVSSYRACGASFVRIDVPVYGLTFSDSEQVIIRQVAVNAGLTWIRGAVIDVKNDVNPDSFHFEISR